MFEQLVANLLNRVLGDYVANLETGQLNIGIWAGDVALKNLKLRSDALNKFDLPVTIASGYIGELTLKIPWHNLKTMPFKFSIDSIYLVIEPCAGQKVDIVKELAKLRASKLKKVEDFIKIITTPKAKPMSSTEESNSYTGPFVTKVIDNMQINIKNIHIRYQDPVSNPKFQYTLGFSLQGLSVVSVNEAWTECFAETQSNVTRKLLRISGVGVHWSRDSASFHDFRNAVDFKTIRALFSDAEKNDGRSHLLLPINGEGRLTINRRYGLDVPKYNLLLTFDEISLSLSELQYENLWYMIHGFERYQKARLYHSIRPVGKDRTPKSLLRFAFQAVLSEVRAKLRPRTLEGLDERRKTRLEFSRLYMKKRLGELDSPKDATALENMYNDINFDDLTAFIRIAERDIRIEKRKRAEAKASAAAAAAQTASPNPLAATPSTTSQTSSWSSWLWGSYASPTNTTESAAPAAAELEDADIQRIIDLDDSFDKEEAALPSDCVLTRVQWNLQKAVLMLQKGSTCVIGDDVSVNPLIPDTLTALQKRLSANVSIRLDGSYHAALSIGDFSIYDAMSSRNSKIVYATDTQSEIPLFNMQYHSGATNNAKIVTQSLTILYSLDTVEALTKFFKPPDTIRDSVQMMTTSLRHQTRAGLEYTLSKHKATAVELTIAAPLFIFPLDKKNVLVLDSGNLSVVSELRDTSDLLKIQERHGILSDEEMKALIALMYDRYRVSLKNMRVVTDVSAEACLECLRKEGTSHAHIVDNLDFDFSLGVSILPQAANVTKLKLSGSMPFLSINLSDVKYKNMMRVVNILSGNPAGTQNTQNDSAETNSQIESFQSTDSLHSESTTPLSIQSNSQVFEPDVIKKSVADIVNMRASEHQNLMEMDFTFDKVRARLKIYDNRRKSERELAMLSFDDFRISVVQRQYDRSVGMSLRTVLLEDLQQPDLSLRSLISSKHGSKELVSISYISAQKRSPLYTGNDQMVSISFEAVQALTTRQSILDIYDFVMVTFGENRNPPPMTPLASAKTQPSLSPSLSQAKYNQTPTSTMQIKLKMKSILFDFNENNNIFASATLGESDFDICLGQSLRVDGVLGILGIISEGQELASIEGTRSAKFCYRSGPPGFGKDGFASQLQFSSESLHLMHRPSEISRLLYYLSEFKTMHNVLEIARRRAVEQPDGATFGFEFQIKSPVIRHRDRAQNELAFFLGQLDAQNKLCSKNSEYETVASLSDIRIETTMNNSIPQKVLDNVQVQLVSRGKNVDIRVSDATIQLNIEQYRLVMGVYEVLKSPESTQNNVDKTSLDASEDAFRTPFPSMERLTVDAETQNTEKLAHRISPLTSGTGTDNGKDENGAQSTSAISWNINLEWPHINCNLYEGGARLAEIHALSVFCKMVLWQSGSFKGEFGLGRLGIRDVRENNYVCRDILPMPPALDREYAYQLLCSFCMSKESSSISLSLDTPTVHVAFDFLQALRNFFNSSYAAQTGLNATSTLTDSAGSSTIRQSRGSTDYVAIKAADSNTTTAVSKVRYEFSVINAKVVFVHDPKDIASRVLVVGLKHFRFWQENSIGLRIEGLGIFLTNLAESDHRARILDDISVNGAVEDIVQQERSKRLFNVVFEITNNILVRVSYQEAMFIQALLDQYLRHFKNTVLEQDFQSSNPLPLQASNDIISAGVSLDSTAISASSADVLSANSVRSSLNSFGEPVRIDFLSQSFNLKTNGARFIIIDDLHDLHVPMVDLIFRPFDVEMFDWSAAMRLSSQISIALNVWNSRNSHWEPMIEPSRLIINYKYSDATALNIRTPELMNINITRQMIETAFTTIEKWPKEYRSYIGNSHKPYLIRNRCGHKLSLWGDGGRSSSADLDDRKDTPWSFDSWHAMRNSTQRSEHTLAVHLHGNPWETLESINIDREQTSNYVLRPPINGRLHYVNVDVAVKDQCKIITLRSPYIFVNKTRCVLELLVQNQTERVRPNEEYSIPIGQMHAWRMRLRPHECGGYEWSASVGCEDIKKTQTHFLACNLARGRTPYRVIMHVTGRTGTKAKGAFPTCKILLSPPLEVRNMLPFKIIYQVLEHQGGNPVIAEELLSCAKADASNIDTSKNLGLRVKIPELDVATKECAIISSIEEMEGEVENEMIELSNDMKLKVRVEAVADSGGVRIVSIYSPFVVRNRLPAVLHLRASSVFSIGVNCLALLSESKVAIYTFGSEWSTSIDLGSLTTNTDLVIPRSGSMQELHIGVGIADGCGHPGESKFVTFSSRFIIRNLTGGDLFWRQHGKHDHFEIKNDEEKSVEWLVEEEVKLVSFRVPRSRLNWSAPVNMCEIGTTYARMTPQTRTTATGQTQQLDIPPGLLEVDVSLLDAIIYISVQKTDKWPFRIENLTEDDIEVYQTGFEKSRILIPSGLTQQYAWEHPSDPEKTLMVHFMGSHNDRVVNLFEIGSLKPHEYKVRGRSSIAALDIHVDGATRVLQVSKFLQEYSVYRKQNRKNAGAAGQGAHMGVQDQFDVVHVNSILQLSYTVNLKLGISLCDSSHEIVYISIDDLEFSYRVSNLYYSYRLFIRWLQIDNQAHSTLEPIVLFPVEVSRARNSDRYTFQIALVKSRDQSRGIQYFKYLTCLLQEISLSVDQDLLDSLERLFAKKISNVEENSWTEILRVREPPVRDNSALKYFEVLEIQPLKVNLSFTTSQSSGGHPQNVLSFVARILSMGLGNIHNFPLRLNSLILEHPIGSFSMLSDTVYKHYRNQVTGNLYKMVGSADFLGNPVGLFNNLASGVHGIFYEPYQGIVSDRPQDLGIGLAKGTATFLSKAVYGVADSFGKFSGAIGKGIATATMDPKFQQSRQVSRTRNRPKHAISGVTTGAKSLAKGFVSAVTGVVTQPLEGAEKSGVEGFFKGVGKGIVGLGAKPIVGIFDMMSNISEGIRNTTTIFEDTEIDRVRLPRLIDSNHVLMPYSARDALGYSWLVSLDGGAYSTRNYVTHQTLDIEGHACILVTDAVIVFRVRKLRVEWIVEFADIYTIKSRFESKEISLVLRGSTPPQKIVMPSTKATEAFFTRLDACHRRYFSENKPYD